MSHKLIIEFDSICDRYNYYLDEEEIFSVDYDEVGWDGLEALIHMAKLMAKAGGIEVEEIEKDYDKEEE